MKKILFYDAKQYDKDSFNSVNKNYEIVYAEAKLSAQTAVLAKGFDVVCAFVNDTIDKETDRKSVV